MTQKYLTLVALVLCGVLSGCGGGATLSSAHAASGPADSASSPDNGASSPAGPVLTGVTQFGVDADGNGVPDRLDAYIKGMPGGQQSKDAATAYYALISKLAAKVLAGGVLDDAERQKVFSSIGCYSLTVRDEAALGATEMDLDGPFMENKRAFRGMHALMSALSGTMARIGVNKKATCAAAK